MINKPLIQASISLILLFGLTANINSQSVKSQSVKLDGLSANDDFSNSPYTGYTKEHWEEISEKIIAGALLHFDKKIGMPDIAVPTDVIFNTNQGVMNIQFEGFAYSMQIPY